MNIDWLIAGLYVALTMVWGGLLWAYSGYFLYLFFRTKRIPADRVIARKSQRTYAIIIPCFNEESLILKKLENTLAIDFEPTQVRVFVVDGGSTDDTKARTEEFCRQHSQYRFVTSSVGGKIAQLNYVLPMINEDVVVVSDVDGFVERDFLRVFDEAFRQPSVGCVGAMVTPENALPEEQVFWEQQNEMRLLESQLGHASTVIAVAYAFLKETLHLFPPDVVADDLYAAMNANTMGYKTQYLRAARAVEKRSGNQVNEVFAHKLRKVNANMRELQRFASRMREMTSPWNVMFFSKYLQHWMVVPFLMTYLIGLFAVFWIDLLSGSMLLGIQLGVAVIAQLVAEHVLSRGVERSDQLDVSRYRKVRYLVLLQLVLIVGFFRYFLVKQTSVYKKVGHR